MSDRLLALKDLLELLPRLPEFDALRAALLHVSDEDARQPAGARPYATVDARVLKSSRLARVLSEAEQAARKRTKSLYDAATLAFSSLAGDAESGIEELIGCAEAAEQEDRWRDAVAFYHMAEGLAQRAGRSESVVLLRRRLGRGYLNIGDLREARHFYQSSLLGAAALDDAEGQIIAATGLGNVASWAGRWPDATDWYERALRMCAEQYDARRAEVMINLGMVANERGQLDAAEHWLQQAHELWHVLSEPTRGGWYNIRGLVHLKRGQLAAAEATFEMALACATGAFHRAMILDNLAETAMQQGAFNKALVRARLAESAALEHGSPRALAEVYMRLGRWCALQNDNNGVAFFDKALALARDGQYPLLLGRIQREYGEFRLNMGDYASARTLLDDARAVFAELGAADDMKDTERLLRSSSAVS